MGIRTFPVAGTGGMTLLSTTAITAVASISITGIDQTYNEIIIVISNAASVSTSTQIRFTFNSVAGTAYDSNLSGGSGGSSAAGASGLLNVSMGTTANVNNANGTLRIVRYTDVTPSKLVTTSAGYVNATASAITVCNGTTLFASAAAISSVQLFLNTGNWTAQGNIYIYGVR